MIVSPLTADIHVRIENRLDERAYFEAFSGEPVYAAAAPTPEPESVSMFAGLPTTTVDAIARHLIGILESEGYIRKQVRPTTAALTQAAVSVPRTVPTPAPREVMDSPRSIVESLAGERLSLRSLWYNPTISLRARWEGIADDGGENTNIKFWLWEEDKQKVIDAGYSAAIFNRTVTRFMLNEAIPVSIKWADSGAKLDQVLPRIEVRRRA